MKVLIVLFAVNCLPMLCAVFVPSIKPPHVQLVQRIRYHEQVVINLTTSTALLVHDKFNELFTSALSKSAKIVEEKSSIISFQIREYFFKLRKPLEGKSHKMELIINN